jgi:hypothetical protein
MSRVNTVQYILQRWHQSSAHPQVSKVISQLKTCRTARQGYHLYQCSNEGCGHYHYRYHSCRNRHCPQCGSFQKQQWIEDRTAELLPTHYFHVVFTLPHTLNSVVLGNRKPLLKLLFDAAAQTLLRLSKDKRYLGATPGILSVLHTWGQQLSFPPHVHCIISGGGLQGDALAPHWKQAVGKSGNFLFPVKVLSEVFRAKFLQGVKRLADAGAIKVKDRYDFNRLLSTLWTEQWVVYAKKAFGGPRQVISYLGGYTHKTAISNHRIKLVNEQEQTVSFSYKDYGDDSKQKLMSLPVSEFIRRFEQHILPKGFTRIRSYGYLSNRGRTGRIQRITEAMKIPSHRPMLKTPWQLRLLLQYGVQQQRCSHCGNLSLQVVKICFPFMLADDG